METQVEETSLGLQERSSNVDELGNPTSAYIHNCIRSWKQIFPWMHYVEESNLFICSSCEWGSIDPALIQIFQLRSAKDLKCVSSKLRKHNEDEKHKLLCKKKEILFKFCKHVYPLVKNFSQDTACLEDIVKTITAIVGGNFPGPEELTAKYAFTAYTIKRIAECIEEDFLNALSESPYFSVLTNDNHEFMIIRWLNKNGESEEHLFCGHISYTDTVENCISYLAMKNIDMNKLVSFSTFSKEPESDRICRSSQIPHVPIRCPSFELFLNWVEEASFLKDMFQQLTVITRLCKTYYHKFAIFPEATDLISMEEPFSHNCIMNERIMNFFFTNLKSLRSIAGDIHKRTRNMEAYGFSAVELQDTEAVKRCAFLFPKLSLLISSVFSESTISLMALENFKKTICSAMRGINDISSGEYALLYVFDIFISHVLVTLMSPGKNITDVLSKSLNKIIIKDIDILVSNLMKDYKGTNAECLDMFKSLCKNMSLSDSSNILELTESLNTKSEYQLQYPEVYELHKKIKVLPCFIAEVQQTMFNVSALQVFLSGRMAKHVLHTMTLIILEGPTVDQIKIEQVIDMWARKWKSSSSSKYNLTNLKEIVYPI